MLSPIDRLVVADAPGWRSDSGKELNAPRIQQLLAEREADKGSVASQYAAIIVPYTSAKSPVLSARLVENDTKSGTMACEVTLAGRKDTIISTLDDQPHELGSVELSGRFGFVSVDGNDRVQATYLLAGTRLSHGQTEITLPKATTPLKVASVAGRTYRLGEPLPQGQRTEGLYLLAGETGYEIESATRDSITVRDYPAIDCEEIRILNSRWEGKR